MVRDPQTDLLERMRPIVVRNDRGMLPLIVSDWTHEFIVRGMSRVDIGLAILDAFPYSDLAGEAGYSIIYAAPS
jgi:hypothetical protein